MHSEKVTPAVGVSVVNDAPAPLQTSSRGCIIVLLSTHKFLSNNKIIVIFLPKLFISHKVHKQAHESLSM